jgi:arylsulfatase A-like enzyme
MSKPNILVIYSDQHRFDCLGAHGHPQLKTPHLDRLAAEGGDFLHAFTPVPMCVPARCSMLSGQWPSQHGVVFNFDGETFKPLDPTLPNLGKTLQQAGYRTAHIGRWHVDRTRPATEYGFDSFLSDWNYHAWRAEQGQPPLPKMPDCWAGEVDCVDPDQSRLAWAADRVIEKIDELAEGDQPFFLRWHTVEPHLPCFPTQPFADLYKAEDLAPWPGFADTFEGKPAIQKQMHKKWGVEGWTWDDWAPVVARYLAVITEFDHHIGRVLDALKQAGLEETTLVVYTADHGDMCGSHGMVDKHFVLYDDVTRVPFIARGPGVDAGTVRDDFVSNAVDLPATLCAVAETEKPESFSGKNVLEPTGREDIFSTYSGNQYGGYSQRMVRDRRWKYIWNLTAEDELYDLKTDPGELINRAKDPTVRSERNRLKQRMIAWLEEVNDPMLNPFSRNELNEK